MNMSNDTILDNLEINVDILISELEKMKEENTNLIKEKTELGNIIKTKDKELEELENKFSTLKFAKTLSGNDNDIHATKIKINKLVREIDNCISLLNK